MSDALPRDRHLDTVAALDILAGLCVFAVVVWLAAGMPWAVNATERALRLELAVLMAPFAPLLLLLGWALLRRAGMAWRLQRWLALALLPLLPVGTAWGLYVLRVLRRPQEPLDAEQRAIRSDEIRPFWGVLAAATVVGSTALSFGALKARELWLERQVEQASAAVASRQQAVSRHIEELRQEGVIDTDSSPLQKAPR